VSKKKKHKKKKHKEKARNRRQRELARLQETLEAKNLEEQQPAAPPPATPASSAVPPAASVAPPSLLHQPAEPEPDRLWMQFERADIEGKEAIFLNALEAGKLDDEYAFEMLTDIHSELDIRDPTVRARYAALVERLCQQAPDLYQHSIAYYHEYLIQFAIIDGRWEALPDLLAPFAEKPDHTIETFTRVIEQLEYHGQVQPLIQVMAQAWPAVSKSAEILPWAIDEFAGRLMQLHLFDYLETTRAPRADDPALLEATAPYGQWKEGWLERFTPRLTASAPWSWRPTDFGEAVDADQWRDNLDNLLAEFVADRYQAGVPYSRGHMAWVQLSKALKLQFAAPTSSKGKQSRKGRKGEKRRKASPVATSSSLVPTYQTMDKTLAALFPFLGAQPYKVAAVMELLPAYLHFLARLGLIHPTEMDTALEELGQLVVHAQRALDNYGADPRAVDAVTAAWSEEALTSLKNDPALAEARATPPAPEPPPPARPTARSGALQTYTFKVTYLRNPDIWCAIEIAETQTLNDLHMAIQEAVGLGADHLYSFYMSGRAWDQDTEYASPYAEGPSAAQVEIHDLNLRMKQRFLYLFDYGDEHHFDVQLVGINPEAPKGKYPRVVERHGKNPPQYGWDEA